MLVGIFCMAISTDDWGLSIYNDNGVDLCNYGVFVPRYIGRLKLRYPFNQGTNPSLLRIVAEDGRELTIDDASKNLPFSHHLGRSAPMDLNNPVGNIPNPGYYNSLNRGIRFLLPLYSNQWFFQGAKGIVPSVIHGWGNGYDREKWEMAELMCNALKSGGDIQNAALLRKKMQGTLTKEEQRNFVLRSLQSGRNPVSGMPVTMSFRSTATVEHEHSGYSSVSLGAGFMVVEMTGGTELEIFFYETAGLPYQYLCRCSTVHVFEEFGLDMYNPSPPLLNYVMATGDSSATAEAFGLPARPSNLITGQVERARWFFTSRVDQRQPRESLANVVATLSSGEDAALRDRVTTYLEGSPKLKLKYEQYSSSMKPLKLLGSINPDASSVQKMPSGDGYKYVVTGGYLFNRVCQPVGILGYESAEYLLGQKIDPGMSAGVHSLWSASGIRTPSPTPDDVFRWNLSNIPRYQPILNYKYSDYLKDAWDGDPRFNLSKWQSFKVGLLSAFNGRMAENLAVSYKQYNKMLEVSKVVRGGDIVFYSKANPVSETQYYQEHIQNAEDALAKELQTESLARSNAAAAWYEQMRNEWAQRQEKEFNNAFALMNQLGNLLNINTSRYGNATFWGGFGYRHSDTSLQILVPAVSNNSETTRKAAPENWLMCQSPNF